MVELSNIMSFVVAIIACFSYEVYPRCDSVDRKMERFDFASKSHFLCPYFYIIDIISWHSIFSHYMCLFSVQDFLNMAETAALALKKMKEKDMQKSKRPSTLKKVTSIFVYFFVHIKAKYCTI